MASKDIITKDYINDTAVFADAFNYFLYDGRQVIIPSKLHVIDTTEIGVPYGHGNTKAPVQKFRDSLKYLSAMKDDTAAYLILGIESQIKVHYAMPVRNMVYDALQYASQVEKASMSYKKASKKQQVSLTAGSEPEGKAVQKAFRWPSSAEYLSGFCKSDRLLPVITLVVFFSPKPWDGPTSIHEMLSVRDEKLLSFVPDYRINLIAPAQTDETSMNKLQTSLREVLLYIKYSEDKEKLDQMLLTDARFRCVERKAAVVINELTNSGIEFDEKEESIDMCLAIREMCRDSRNEGEKIGAIRVNKLNSKLLELNRIEDLKRSTKDLAYQKKLMAELLGDE